MDNLQEKKHFEVVSVNISLPDEIRNGEILLRAKFGYLLSREELIGLLRDAHEKGSFDFARKNFSTEDSWQEYLTEKGLTEPQSSHK